MKRCEFCGGLLYFEDLSDAEDFEVDFPCGCNTGDAEWDDDWDTEPDDGPDV